MQTENKPVQFSGGAGEFFVVVLLTAILSYVILLGWPVVFNLVAGYVVNNLTVNGKKLKYSAGYVDVLGFLLVNILLLVITFGIWSFWFGPRIYRFVADHTSYAEGHLTPLDPTS